MAFNVIDTTEHLIKNSDKCSKTDQTTKLVAFMAICYIIAEGPVGVLYVLQGVVLEPYGIVEMTVNLIDIFGTFFSLNAIMHPVICLTVSSQYKKSAKELFCFGKCTKRKTTPMPKHSVTIHPSARTASAK
ncbi:hypothetical protein CAEBREN_12325 [Caenorhabditis brenneri]|uniref:G-protein coupled receptors family 1 profile domain-containing protein n=1 Tax=Caenorhabditis brenneri TaxID=135651 RepID=G0M9S6_CAEBE|nr:hypothetical protein CAEBREN_12325 [Caenorhabditis brenneri]